MDLDQDAPVERKTKSTVLALRWLPFLSLGRGVGWRKRARKKKLNTETDGRRAEREREA